VGPSEVEYDMANSPFSDPVLSGAAFSSPTSTLSQVGGECWNDDENIGHANLLQNGHGLAGQSIILA
jgi:hypothetical protein